MPRVIVEEIACEGLSQPGLIVIAPRCLPTHAHGVVTIAHELAHQFIDRGIRARSEVHEAMTEAVALIALRSVHPNLFRSALSHCMGRMQRGESMALCGRTDLLFDALSLGRLPLVLLGLFMLDPDRFNSELARSVSLKCLRSPLWDHEVSSWLKLPVGQAPTVSLKNGVLRLSPGCTLTGQIRISVAGAVNTVTSVDGYWCGMDAELDDLQMNGFSSISTVRALQKMKAGMMRFEK